MINLGVLDSGIGGLSLLQDLINSHVLANYYYISDNQNVPYGEKSQEFMLERMKFMVTKLIEKNVDAIVIACNTATAKTIDKLRSEFEIPFFGIEPYINYLNHSQKDNLALILTTATYNSERFQQLRLKYDPENKVKIYPLPKLALVIEKLKEISFSKIEDEVKTELKFLENDRVDCLILGCTHYPLIKNFIESKYKLDTIDPNHFVISHLIKTMEITDKGSVNNFYYNQNATETWESKSIDWLHSLQN